MKHFLSWFGRKAMNGIIPGLLFTLTVASVTYALTYNWSDPTSIRNQTAGNPLTSAGWNLLVGNVDNLNERLTGAEGNGGIVPTGAVMAFNLATCPTGWSPADGGGGRPDLRGEFIRGLDNGRGVDAGRTLKSWQDGATKLLMNWSVDPVNPGNSPEGNSPTGIIAHKPSIEMIWINTWFWGWYTARFTLRGAMDTNWWWATETRPRNIALLYCVKN